MYKNYINGEWVASAATKTIPIYDPTDATNVIGQVP